MRKELSLGQDLIKNGFRYSKTERTHKCSNCQIPVPPGEQTPNRKDLFSKKKHWYYCSTDCVAEHEEKILQLVGFYDDDEGLDITEPEDLEALVCEHCGKVYHECNCDEIPDMGEE